MGILQENNALLIILILSTLALLLFFVIKKRSRRGTYSLEKDSTGFFRYHKDTQFDRKLAYQKRINKKNKKTETKEIIEIEKNPKSIAVIHFEGDMRAKQHKTFAQFVDEILVNRENIEEVVIVVTSPGGVVPNYGHLFSEMERVRNADLSLTVCIDVVAASGGYLMSLPAHKIIAAPFAIVGSIGVVAFIPNIRNLLLDWKITPRTFTAGKYKRTVTLTDDANSEEIQRFQNQLEAIHRLFVSSVKKYRPGIKLDMIETGDHWTAQETIELELGLIDELQTSYQYLQQRNLTKDLVLLSHKKNIWEDGVGRFFMRLVDKVEQRLFSATILS